MAGSLGSTIFVVIASKASMSETMDLAGIDMAFGVQAALIVLGFIAALVFVKSRIQSKIADQTF